MKYHVHVYKIVAKAEFDFDDVEDEVEARKKALSKAKEDDGLFGESDCKLLALTFEGEK